MDESEKIKQIAEEFARANKKRITAELTDIGKFPSEPFPISVFMAGSPGAGKTEFSRNFLEDQESESGHKIIRIDADELRAILPGYTGSNSYLFQKAISILVDEIHNKVLDQNQTFLLDGTFSKYDRAVLNIKRSLSRSRKVNIFYVYQKPEIAWRFTTARESLEGRNIPKQVFVDQFISSRQTIERIRQEFDDRVVIHLVMKNFETHAVEAILMIDRNGPQIDHYLGMAYTKDDLEKLL